MIINDEVLAMRRGVTALGAELGKLSGVGVDEVVEPVVYGYTVSQWGELLGKVATPFEIELCCYQQHVQGNLSGYKGNLRRWEHLKRAFLIYMREYPDPVFVVDGVNTWDVKTCWYAGMDWMLWAFCDEVDLIEDFMGVTRGSLGIKTIDEIAIPAASQMSKTWFMSKVCALHTMSNPADTLGYLTTTDAASLGVKLWGDVKKFMLQCPDVAGSFELHDSQQDRSFVWGNNEKCGIYAWAVARGERAVGRFSGGRNKQVWALIDEAPQTPPVIIRTSMGNLRSGTIWRKTIMLGNLGDGDNEMARLCEPVGGFGDDTPKCPFYLSRNRILVLQLDSLRSNPNIRQNPNVDVELPDTHPFLQLRRDVKSIRDKSGENSDAWWRWVRGWPAPGDIGSRLIPKTWILRGHGREPFVFIPGTVHCGWGLDPAYGGDRCVWLPYTVGETLIKAKNSETGEVSAIRVYAVQLGSPVNIKLKSDPQNPEAYQILAEVVALCSKWELEGNPKMEPDYCGLDATGGDLYAIMQKEWSPDIESIFFGDPASDRKLRVTDPKSAKDMVDRYVTEMWLAVGMWLAEGQLRGLSDCAAQELGARLYEPCSRDRKRAETKVEMRSRVKYSPDEGDSVAIVIEIIRRKGYIAGGQMTGGAGRAASNDPMLVAKRLSKSLWNPTFTAR